MVCGSHSRAGADASLAPSDAQLINTVPASKSGVVALLQKASTFGVGTDLAVVQVGAVSVSALSCFRFVMFPLSFFALLHLLRACRLPVLPLFAFAPR